MQLGTAGQNPANVNLVSIGGGKVNFAGVLSLAFLNPIALSGIGPGTLMIGGGTVTLTNGGIAKYTLGALNSTTNVATLILNSTNNADPAVLDLNGHAIGTATEPIDNAQFMAGTLKNLSEFNGGSNVVKTGAGLLTLSGANTYTGGTVVGGGTLFFDADMALSPNTPLFDVGAGAVLDVSALTGGTLALGAIIPQILIGGGTILGNVNVMANSTVSPGHSTGTLTVTNAITLGGTTIMELNRANVPNSDRIVAASITYGGALSVTNDGSTLHAGDSFLLFSGPTSGSFATVNLPSTDYTGATYTWTNKLAVDGTIAVLTAVGGTSTTPTNITFVLNGGALTLSWPADHTGWYLQAQTNSLAIGLSSNWFTVPGSQTTNQVNTMIDPTKGCVFYRLFLP
jgi:autotransporter-associated beta strand protein